MTYPERRKHLILELKQLKKEGFRVFINKPSREETSVYGIITDNTNILHVQYSEYNSDLLQVYFKYVPDKKTGDCCSVTKTGYGYEHLNKEIFEESVQRGHVKAAAYHATLYEDFDHYLKTSTWAENHYMEL